jgi:hypothetical protein
MSTRCILRTPTDGSRLRPAGARVSRTSAEEPGFTETTRKLIEGTLRDADDRGTSDELSVSHTERF